jgi:hypothetical protein
LNVQESSCIGNIEEVRKKNNVNWMELLRLAVEYVPAEKLVPVLNGIDKCDKQINLFFHDLTELLNIKHREGI